MMALWLIRERATHVPTRGATDGLARKSKFSTSCEARTIPMEVTMRIFLFAAIAVASLAFTDSAVSGEPDRLGEYLNLANLGHDNTEKSRQKNSEVEIAVVCFKTGEKTSGMNKICFYDCLGSAAAITIGATQLCPLTINR